MRVRLSEEARKFLATETEYLRQRNPAAARKLVERMRQARRNLGDFPNMGSAAEDGPLPGTRSLVIDQYILTYDVSAKSVEVTAIRHGRMQVPTPDVEEDFDYEAEPTSPKP